MNDQSKSDVPKWSSVMTDPDWKGDESANRGWEKTAVATWETMGNHKSASNEKHTEEHEPDREGDADIMAFLGLGKDAAQTYGDMVSHDEHEKVLSYLGITKTEKASMLVTLGINEGMKASDVVGEESLSAHQSLERSDNLSSGSGSQFEQNLSANWELRDSKSKEMTQPTKALSVTAPPFQPAKLGGKDEGPRLNPAAVPFVPRTTSPQTNGFSLDAVSAFKPFDGVGENELARAQAAVRHYQAIFTNTKEELQACNKMYQRERETSRKSQEALEQKCKEVDRIRAELHAEVARSKQANDQLEALQGEMAYYKKFMEHIQGQLQVTWTQFMGQLQQEKAARHTAEESTGQLQAALQAARLEAEQLAAKVAEQQGSLKEAQLLVQQQQERAEVKEKEAVFYRTMYTTATKQVESSTAAVRASMELERQARQEAEARSGEARMVEQQVPAVKPSAKQKPGAPKDEGS